jgi:hypothetical protein
MLGREEAVLEAKDGKDSGSDDLSITKKASPGQETVPAKELEG